MTQLDFLDQIGVVSHAEAAREWMASHPEAMHLFEEFARRMMKKERKFGMKLLVERVRWEIFMEKDDGAKYKLNNNYTAYIGRELCRRIPGLSRWVETRRVRS